MKSNRYWFVPKIYGYGYVPITWEGWLIVLAILLLISFSGYINNFFSPPDGPSIKNVLSYILELTLFIFAINPFMKSKTRGEVRWSWGKR